MMWDWHAGAAGWWMMGIGWIVWILLIVAATWLVVRALTTRSTGTSSETAEELLRRRYAAGEIDTEEFDRRLEVLRRR